MQPSDMARALSRARTLLGEGTALKLQVFCEIASAPTGCIEQEALHDRVRAKRSTLSALLHDLSDVDHFKRYNDTYGHAEGDRCLAAVAGVIAASMRRPADFCARHGGEEFVVLLPRTDGDGARHVGEAIRAGVAALAMPHRRSEAGIVTVSVGVAACARPHEAASDGLFEAADGGTIFLDEIGEMSPGMQTKLLRVLQEGEVRRVGDTALRKIEVRVIAASNRDLEAMVAAGTFRKDLLYRIRVVKIDLPPLRSRPEDLTTLVEHFLARHDKQRRLTVSAAAMRALARYAWPGNIRELENEVQRWVALVETRVELADLTPAIVETKAGGGRDPDDLRLRPRLDRLERELIDRAMATAQGNQTRAATLLGLSRFGLQKKLRRLAEGVPLVDEEEV